MSAAPPGTITLSCTTDAGILTVTARYNPDTGAFNPDALTATGTGSGSLRLILNGDGPLTYAITAGDTISADTLAADGVTGWSQAHSMSLTALDAP